MTVHPCAPLALHADPGRLTQVLANLLGNALKYARSSIAVRVLPGAECRATSSIAATGTSAAAAGAPAAAADHALQPGQIESQSHAAGAPSAEEQAIRSQSHAAGAHSAEEQVIREQGCSGGTASSGSSVMPTRPVDQHYRDAESDTSRSDSSRTSSTGGMSTSGGGVGQRQGGRLLSLDLGGLRLSVPAGSATADRYRLSDGGSPAPAAPAPQTPRTALASSAQQRSARSSGCTCTCVRVEVADDGPGMTRESARRLFRPFSQLQGGASAQEAAGTGLGLAIARTIVQLSGGRIGVVSPPPQQGSVFFFELPAEPAGAAHPPASAAAAAEGQQSLRQPQLAPLVTGDAGQAGASYAAATADASAADTVPLRHGRQSPQPSPLGPAGSARAAGSTSPRGPPAAQLHASLVRSPLATRRWPGLGQAPSTPRQQSRSQVTLAAAAATQASATAPSAGSAGGAGGGPSQLRPQGASGRERQPEGHADAADSHSGSGLTDRLQPLRQAFLVDDDGVSRRLVAHLLRRNGVASEQAGDGFAALEALRQAGGKPEAEAGLQPIGAAAGSQPGPPSPLTTAAQTRAAATGSGAGLITSSAAPATDTSLSTAAAEGPAQVQAQVQVWLIDHHMPGMDGPELVKELRQAGVTAPIIGVTGDEGAFPGADAVVCKPLTLAALEEALASVGLRMEGRP